MCYSWYREDCWCLWEMYSVEQGALIFNTYLLTPWCTVLLEKLAASQEIPRISRNPKVHYRTHKRPPPLSILGLPYPVHIPTSHLLEIHPNIIHPSTPRSPQWSLSLRFLHQDPIHPPLLTHMPHMPNPSHSSRFYQYFYKTHTPRKNVRSVVTNFLYQECHVKEEYTE